MVKKIHHVKALPSKLDISSLYFVKPDSSTAFKLVITSLTGSAFELDVVTQASLLSALKDKADGLAGLDWNKLLSSGIGVNGQDLRIIGPGNDNVWAKLSAPLEPRDWTTSTSPYYGTITGTIMGAIYRDARIQQASCNIMMNSDVVVSRAVYPFINWTPLTNVYGTVRWGIEYTVAKNHSQMAFTTTKTIYIEQYVYYGQVLYNLIAISSDADAIPATNIEPDSVIKMRVFRDGSHKNDTYAAEVHAWAAGIKYCIARIGTKNKAPNFFQ